MELKPNRQVLAKRAEHARATKSGRMIRGNERGTREAKASWTKWLGSMLDWNKKRRKAAQRKARKAAHAMRILRDAKYAKRVAKRRRDYVRCRANSCHA